MRHMEILTVQNLAVDYGSFRALEITQPLRFSAGDRIGIIGGNGAGKSTFAKALCGLVNYTGSIQTQLKQRDIAMHLQENAYVKRMPVSYIIEAVFNTSIYKNERLLEIIRFFDFESCLKKRFAQLSGGQKQKLTIIMILFQDRPLTFFDEVTSGLDFESRVKLMQKVQEWYREKNTTVCVVSHYYDELEKFVNKLLIIDKGRVAAFGDVDTLFKRYCADVIVVIENNADNQRLTQGIEKIHAPAHLMAFPCRSKKDEEKICKLLISNGVNFKRSDKDIEILFVNAVNSMDAEGADTENLEEAAA